MTPEHLIASFGGGIVRGIVGFIKYQYSFRTVPFNAPYFLTVMVLSGIIGIVTVTAVQEAGLTILGVTEISPALSFIIGYAGGDFLENVFKIAIKKPTLWE